MALRASVCVYAAKWKRPFWESVWKFSAPECSCNVEPAATLVCPQQYYFVALHATFSCACCNAFRVGHAGLDRPVMIKRFARDVKHPKQPIDVWELRSVFQCVLQHVNFAAEQW